jgi:hypothetical protein
VVSLGSCKEFPLLVYPIVSFLSGFILTLYAGFELELGGAQRQREGRRKETIVEK